MTTSEIANWMQAKLAFEGCLYQEDVVDYLVKQNHEEFLIENADGNLSLAKNVLNAFRKLNEKTVVWVKPGKYWRFRVSEDEDGRDARG
ncbi:hypothetical protein VBQ95_23285 [Klebsiella pneumoniae]|uniref:DUF6953 family protein n=1 Tax=Klebsiella pneumoniae complex TaxID=3390273 RepID=UPI0019A695A9|nr:MULTISPECIES: hypothetical protein [Klebsiella]MBD7744808.1 hypothetical protein [Klebsiella pneumoniae]MCY0511174.1 hypothetical protein [Klebsiella pneumoniae]MEA4399885.1 hypothetical protein [Klebsiella pneumoniae]